MTRVDVGPYPVRFTDDQGVSRNIPGFDDLDDMMKIKSIQKKFRDSWTRPLAELWDVVESGGSTAIVSGGNLTINSGTTAGGFVELLSKDTFTIPFRAMVALTSGATRQANTHHIVEAVSVDPVTGVPDGKHSLQADIGGAASTTVTQMKYAVQNGGLAPLESAAVTIVTTASPAILELEPFSDECYFHSRTLDATTGRSNSYVRHQQIPDPSAFYKLRIRSMNHQAWKLISNAVAGPGGVIRLTSTAHGLTGTQTVWIEALNGLTNGGADIRGNYSVTVVDANTLDMDGSTFAGAYVTGSGRFALAAAPAANIGLVSAFINCQDYAELTAEITAGRGQTVIGQGVGVNLLGAPSTTTAIGQVVAVGPVAHDGARGSSAPIIVSGRGISAAYTTVSTGDVADFVTTLQGVQIVKPWQIPELEWNYAAAAGGIVNTTDVVLAAAAGAGLRRYITSMQVKNTNATATELVLKDGATVIWRGHVAASMTTTETITFACPLKTTANAALNVACVTTGAAVYVNAQGYTAP